jgi:triphosphoribosyl-dephospho-CoA synthase
VTAGLRALAVGAPAAFAGDAAARWIGRAAISALREELRVWPKPGLVTLHDGGAHADMDAATFLVSLRALDGAFEGMARAGAERSPFATLQGLGIRAEARMLEATDGVNTHRGAIFTLGVLAAAAGRVAGEGGTLHPAALRDTVRRTYGPAIVRHLPRASHSHGAVALRRHGVGGARAEAHAGFPHLFDVALPALVESRRRGAGRRAAAVQCLLCTIAVLPDTNLLYRGGARGLSFARSAAGAFVRAGGVHRKGWEEQVRGLHAAFVARGLSPGGSADLLAAALFVDALERGDGAAARSA